MEWHNQRDHMAAICFSALGRMGLPLLYVQAAHCGSWNPSSEKKGEAWAPQDIEVHQPKILARFVHNFSSNSEYFVNSWINSQPFCASAP